eukprot:1136855-Pelagomonas_calceolata.AAC.1
MEFRAHRQISHQICTLILGQGRIRSHTCTERRIMPPGKFLSKISMAAWAQGYVQKTCSCSWSARTVELAASAVAPVAAVLGGWAWPPHHDDVSRAMHAAS